MSVRSHTVSVRLTVAGFHSIVRVGLPRFVEVVAIVNFIWLNSDDQSRGWDTVASVGPS